MKSFDYVIKDEVGIHARPAGLLGKKCKEFASTVTIAKGDKEAGATKLMALMGLGVKCGDTVTVKTFLKDAEEGKEVGSFLYDGETIVAQVITLWQ